MVAIYAVWYNWLRIHKTLRVTPAMAAGLSKTVVDCLSDIIEAMDLRKPPKLPARAVPTRSATKKFLKLTHYPEDWDGDANAGRRLLALRATDQLSQFCSS